MNSGVLFLHISIYWSDWMGNVKQADGETGFNTLELINGIIPRGIYIFKEESMHILFFSHIYILFAYHLILH